MLVTDSPVNTLERQESGGQAKDRHTLYTIISNIPKNSSKNNDLVHVLTFAGLNQPARCEPESGVVVIAVGRKMKVFTPATGVKILGSLFRQ